MQDLLSKAKEIITSKKAISIAAGTLAVYGLARLYFRGGVCKVSRDLTGQTVVVTGGSAGIGKETVKQLAKKGCTIIFGARDKAKSEAVVQEVLNAHKDCKIYFFPLDLADKRSIEEFSLRVKEICDKIDILINNAGVSILEERKTKDGFEMNMGVNHLGHFYLTYLLWDKIKKVEKPRIIVLSSLAHKGRGLFDSNLSLDFDDLNMEKKFVFGEAYGRSKLANVLFARELQTRMQSAGIDGVAVSLHPGVILTEVFREIGIYFLIFKMLFWPLILLCFKTIPEGAQTTLYLVHEEHNKLQKG